MSTVSADVGTFESSDAKLKQKITLIGLIGLAVSIQVGSGWLLATLAAVSRSGPAAIIAWVIGALFFALNVFGVLLLSESNTHGGDFTLRVRTR
jgi:amino acid transporter